MSWPSTAPGIRLEPDGAAPKAFISHAAHDGGDFAARLDEALRQRGVDTWLCVRDLNHSMDFTAELERAIEAADLVIVCITPDVKRQDSYVRREIEYAQRCRKRVAVARFGEILPPISVVTNTYFEFHRDWDAAFERLLAFCRTV